MSHQFLFIAAENDALPECKAGGMGDVVRDVPREIAERGDTVRVVVPSYGRLHQAGTLVSTLEFSLRGVSYSAGLFRVEPKKNSAGITHYVIHHPEITAGEIAHMYHHDPDEPFYTDTVKFTIFCTAVAEGVKQGAFGDVQFIHLHDWHSSLLLFLREFHPDYSILKNIRVVYSIHNLAIQGIRPFEGNYSSLEHWYPGLDYDRKALQDPRYSDCMNLMALGIRLADGVHTVSPTYKNDIMKPSAPPEFIGGEGLEEDLANADRQGRLHGILNGCNYLNIRTAQPGTLFPSTAKAIFRWLQMEDKKYKADFLAHTGEKVIRLMEEPPGMICSSVANFTRPAFGKSHTRNGDKTVTSHAGEVSEINFSIGGVALVHPCIYSEGGLKQKDIGCIMRCMAIAADTLPVAKPGRFKVRRRMAHKAVAGDTDIIVIISHKELAITRKNSISKTTDPDIYINNT